MYKLREQRISCLAYHIRKSKPMRRVQWATRARAPYIVVSSQRDCICIMLFSEIIVESTFVLAICTYSIKHNLTRCIRSRTFCFPNPIEFKAMMPVLLCITPTRRRRHHRHNTLYLISNYKCSTKYVEVLKVIFHAKACIDR